eukprot:jgi/Mesvir1/6825/Mv26505-RA.1
MVRMRGPWAVIYPLVRSRACRVPWHGSRLPAPDEPQVQCCILVFF